MTRVWKSGMGAVLVAAPFLWLAAALAGDTIDVHIADYKYSPMELQVRAGAVVRWVNDEKRTSHSILFLGPEGFESERIFPGESWQRTFDKPGRYSYRCGPHPEMQGVVVVTE